tara:strand:+ start:672 stop:965 length:294 start_codon:yes stop_codon:yes gene_type:complete
MELPKSVEIARAIKAIRPKAQFSVGETYESFVWYDTEQEKPTEDEFNQAISDDNANQYQRDRAVAYDPITEQLDQIYHDIDGWKKRIKSVKDKYPKP